MLLMFVLALNMFGVFELGTSRHRHRRQAPVQAGIAGSFFSGVLATVVATPCSAPFLGAGIGAAIGLPAVPFFAAFTAMALGLALPYLVLSVFPQLIEKLPRPGPWMESFKQAMSFLLFATAGFLLWVYVGLTRPAVDARRRDRPVRDRRRRLDLRPLEHPGPQPPHPHASRSPSPPPSRSPASSAMLPPDKDLKWGTWSEHRVDELLADGTPVFIDFTAQWCLTCQINKKRAYSKDVVALMKERGIVALKADNTDRDPEIDRTIRSLDRGAVPGQRALRPRQGPDRHPGTSLPGIPDRVVHQRGAQVTSPRSGCLQLPRGKRSD